MFYTVVVVLLVSALVLMFVWPGILTGGVPFWRWSPQLTQVEANIGQTLQQTIPIPPNRDSQVVPEQPPREEAPSDQTGHNIPKRQDWIVPVRWRCSGDLDIWSDDGWYSPYLFENDTDNIGQIVFFTQQSRVYAPYGAYCDPDDTEETMKNQMRQNGCVNGCRDFNIVNWP